jgi:hypothetical protein
MRELPLARYRRLLGTTQESWSHRPTMPPYRFVSGSAALRSSDA